VLLVVPSSYDLEKFCTLIDHVLRWDGSRTTSLRHQGDEKTSSPFDLRTDVGDFYGLRDLCDLPSRSC
jgi:hypothetical protein